MLPSSRSNDRDHGSAALEFILMGLILLVPIVYLVVVLGLIQSESLGVESGARRIGRAISLADDAESARAAAERALQETVDAYGLDPHAVEIELRCLPAGPACPRAGATLHVTVRTEVVLPLAPPVLGLDRLARIRVEGNASQRISRLWGIG